MLVSPPFGKSINATVHSWCMKGPSEKHAKLILLCMCFFDCARVMSHDDTTMLVGRLRPQEQFPHSFRIIADCVLSGSAHLAS